MKLVHAISPIPAALWGANLRKVMPQSWWSKLRKELIKERGLSCETCGKKVLESRNLFAHEEWQFDKNVDPCVARLFGISLSCWHCHAIEHFGATKNLVHSGQLTVQAIDDTIAHFCRLNDATKTEFEEHHESVFAQWAKDNQRGWIVDWGSYSDEIAAKHGRLPFADPVTVSDRIKKGDLIAMPPGLSIA